ncbi:MAG: replication initiator protein A [Ruminococcaceae bacterium]|nr:replication initiator protein A [Oscillospiraceae bacterium]
MSHNNYYYGKEAEQYTFYRIPKALFADEKYRGLSSDAKLLYSLMLDRMGLSMQNQWFDKENRAYIYFTQREVQEMLSCGHNKANALFADLEKVGLIERKRQGLGRPDMIFVLKFSTSEKKEGEAKSPNKEFSYPEKKHQSVSKKECNNTEINKTEYNYNNPSINEPMDEDEMDGLCELLHRNIDYEILRKKSGADAEMVDEIVNLLEDVLRSNKEEIRIGSAAYPKEVVKNRILKLNSEHILYVIDSLKNTRTEIGNIYSYLLTSLYNAPTTMDCFWATQLCREQKKVKNA